MKKELLLSLFDIIAFGGGMGRGKLLCVSLLYIIGFRGRMVGGGGGLLLSLFDIITFGGGGG